MKFHNRYIAVGLVTISLLSSCTVSRKYSRTDLNMPEKFRQQATVTGDTVLLPWRTFFKDAQLVSLIEKALAKNSEVSIAMMNMEQLELAYKQAKSGLLPTLDLNVGASRNYLSKNSLNGSLSSQFLGTSYMDDYSATLRLSWEADIWGKAKMQKRSAWANYFAEKENLLALKTRIIVQVAQAYYNLISLDEQLKIAQKNIALSDSTLSMIRLQFNSGQINSLAVEQAEAQKKTTELLVPLALKNIAVQENALSLLSGSYPDSIERTTNLISEEVFSSGVPALLLSRRPDIKAAEYAVVSANSKTGLAKAAMYPAISLTPSIGANSFKINTWFDLPGSLVKNIGVNLTQPIFQKRSLKTAYEVAEIEQKKSIVQFKQSVLTAVGEVSDAMARSQYASERIELANRKSASLAKATKDAMMLYQSGMATYLEVITAQNNALQNDLEAISIKQEKVNAITDLYRALGGGTE
ncbi:efflux transporter, outer membrane factor (OMF) lipoprotein, NodT family [Chitinophaga sp. CF118]|uniref:efflux transporter outer membrane subunit n=1 Tax=Chitinophaga sp. CF118 TaxID=1884367 RepID=UPI0008F35DB1|nr:TolC family protein [Chitinophaga sp. CF118]SFF09892.1 efflux transporter, outer membrane factor (OMF) lipoprotein, NodT family [Chitinophaga sp. CF118]